jgi:predicted nucleic acid-binding protein
VAEHWVINASPVILLAKADLIQFVPSVAQTLVVPEPVAAEIQQCREVDAAVKWLEEVGRKFVCAPASEIDQLINTGIGPAERSVISWAAANPGFVAVLDDSEARIAARRAGIRVIGTVSVILELKRASLIPEIKPHLLEIRRVGGYISDELFQEALRRAGE